MATGAVAGIALIDTSASPVLGSGVPAAAAQLVRLLTPAAAQGHVRGTGGRAGHGRRPGDLATVYCRLAFGSNPSPTHIELLRAMTSAVPAPVLGELLQTLLNLDVRPALAAITVPALIVVGARDLLTPVWHSRYLAHHLPVSELHVLPGAGHMVPWERRAELARLLTDFAQRCQPLARGAAAANGDAPVGGPAPSAAPR
jgi:pimeloyl-ACP methyl ester carboxylesterase